MKRYLLPTAFLAIAISFPADAEVKISASSHIGANPATDLLANSIILTNEGDGTILETLTVNGREECLLQLYAIDVPLTAMKFGMRPYLALIASQVSSFAEMGKVNNKELVAGPVAIRTGDRIAILPPPIVPAFSAAGVPDAGICGNALVQLTIHTDDGDIDLRFSQ